MSQFVALKTSGINSSGLKLKTLNGKSYLAGPVVMAKEMVMNSLLYTKEELKRAVPGWNGRPVMVNHPVNTEGDFVTANNPDTLESSQIGFIFDAVYRDSDNKLIANVWLDNAKLDTFTDVRDAISNEKTLEVSTGLFLDLVQEEGVFANKKYSGKAVNHLPDHLALLPNEIGACSVADGAGFPRVNVTLGTNEVTYYERSRLVRKALQEKLGEGVWFYVEEVLDASIVVYMSGALYAYDYTFNSSNGTVTLGEGVEVYQQVEYPPVSSLGTNMEKEVVAEKPVEAASEVGVNTAQETAPIEAAATEPVVTEPAVETPTVNAEQEEALALLADMKATAIATIVGNSEAGFTEDELKGMPYAQLKKIAALAGTTQANADMSGLGSPGGMSAHREEVKETPYVG